MPNLMSLTSPSLEILGKLQIGVLPVFGQLFINFLYNRLTPELVMILHDI